MFIWFAGQSSLRGWLHRGLLVAVLVMLISQMMSKPALAASPEQQLPKAQEEPQTAPSPVEQPSDTSSAKQEGPQQPETTRPPLGEAPEDQQAKVLEDQQMKADEDAGALKQEQTPNDKKADNDYPEYCKYESLLYDPACNAPNDKKADNDYPNGENTSSDATSSDTASPDTASPDATAKDTSDKATSTTPTNNHPDNSVGVTSPSVSNLVNVFVSPLASTSSAIIDTLSVASSLATDLFLRPLHIDLLATDSGLADDPDPIGDTGVTIEGGYSPGLNSSGDDAACEGLAALFPLLGGDLCGMAPPSWDPFVPPPSDLGNNIDVNDNARNDPVCGAAVEFLGALGLLFC